MAAFGRKEAKAGIRQATNPSQWEQLGFERCRRFRRLLLRVLVWHFMGSAGCGVAWLKSQSAKNDRTLHNRRHHPLPPSGVAPLRSSFRPPVSSTVVAYARSNSVPSRSIACMMIARRRARATRALRIVDRRAIAKAQSLSLKLALEVAGQHDVGGFVEKGSHPSIPALRDVPAGIVDFSRLIAPRDQAQIGADATRSADA